MCYGWQRVPDGALRRPYFKTDLLRRIGRRVLVTRPSKLAPE